MKRLRVTVHGSVQGIGFRYFVKNVADSLGLKGWVKNNPDGNVCILVEGEDKLVDKFIENCKKGPPSAKVDKLYVSEEKDRSKFRSFDIVF